MTHDTKAPTLVEALEHITRDHNPNSDVHPVSWWIDLVWSYKKMARAALRAHEAATAPGHTDLMVSPEIIDAFMEANPLPALEAAEGAGEADGPTVASVIASHMMDEFEWPRSLAEQVGAQLETTIRWAVAAPSRARQAEGWEDLAEAIQRLQGFAAGTIDYVEWEDVQALLGAYSDLLATPAPPPVTLEREAVARIIWNRFGPPHDLEFPGAVGEWGSVADTIIALAARGGDQ